MSISRSASAKDEQEIEQGRPRRRADCAGGARPCPWVSCRHHLLLEADRREGTLRIRGRGRAVLTGVPFGDDDAAAAADELERMSDTCALDVADRGGLDGADVARVLELTRQRVNQIEQSALSTLNRRASLRVLAGQFG